MTDPDERADSERTFWSRVLSVRREERPAVLFAVLAFFCLLFAVFLLKPLRDEMGLRGGARNLKYLWTVTLAGTVVASAAFAAGASRFPRRAFLAWTYRGVAIVWLAFLPGALRADGELGVLVARAFYVVHAVSNVFVVSLFWALAADLFDVAQSKRLFALIGVGGTLGALAGSGLTKVVAASGYAAWMIVPAVLLMEAAVRFSSSFARRATPRLSGAGEVESPRLGGDFLEGMRLVARSRYLIGIALFTFVFGVAQTIFTLQLNFAIEGAIADKNARTEYFAGIENAGQWLTLLAQLFVTGHVLRRLGLGVAMLVLPFVGVFGFTALGAAHLTGMEPLMLASVCLVVWRGLSHATMRPAREALYVPTSRAEKFKAKSFADTFAFRTGDLASAWGFDKLPLWGAALLGVPLTLVWGALGWWLSCRQQRLVESRETDARCAAASGCGDPRP